MRFCKEVNQQEREREREREREIKIYIKSTATLYTAQSAAPTGEPFFRGSLLLLHKLLSGSEVSQEKLWFRKFYLPPDVATDPPGVCWYVCVCVRMIEREHISIPGANVTVAGYVSVDGSDLLKKHPRAPSCVWRAGSFFNLIQVVHWHPAKAHVFAGRFALARPNRNPTPHGHALECYNLHSGAHTRTSPAHHFGTITTDYCYTGERKRERERERERDRDRERERV